MTRSLAAAGSGAGLIALLLATTPVQAETDTRTITLIHMNDLHAHLVPHLDLVRVASDGGAPPHMQLAERGGLARLATLIRRIREDNPDSLLMNVGDTYHGGVEVLYTRGNAIVAPVDALGIDVGVPGNWDFAYAPLVTRLRYAPEPSRLARFVNWLLGGDPVERPGFPNLAANHVLLHRRNALEAGEAATPAHPRITDRGATQQWPIARFVAPLREDAPQDGG